mgnify:CR=1 FL=1
MKMESLSDLRNTSADILMIFVSYIPVSPPLLIPPTIPVDTDVFAE